jgi:3-isopropylmalate/(R)-2-methylmalate dehydratase large subunit
MTIIEQILARHSSQEKVKPGDIIDISIDTRLARDFGGANVVKNILDNNLHIEDASKTFFTFDCNPSGSDQKYAANQHYCRRFARESNIKVFDIHKGIGTHIAIDEHLAKPGGTLVSTDSHANILGAICCFGQGMGDRDIAAAWAKGSVWFKVPESVKITLQGKRPENITAKDIVLNVLKQFGANTLLGMAVEMYGEEVDNLSLDERITISSMATEMGAITLLFPPTGEVEQLYRKHDLIGLDLKKGAKYKSEFEVNLASFLPSVSKPGKPHDVVPVSEVEGTKIDSVFIGSCSNGRLSDLRVAAQILKGKKVAPGVVLKVVPSTDRIWKAAMDEGLITTLKEAGALIGNAGCAGCAAGQVGQNGPKEITISTGNRNFAGKQGKGEVYLASPSTAAASALAGFITSTENLPVIPKAFEVKNDFEAERKIRIIDIRQKPIVLEGKVWIIPEDNIDTDMIFHNQHLAITNINEMGKHTFGNLKGWEDYATKSEEGDIVITGKNFGSGSSRQQAVDCFKALKNQAILAESFGTIYERNAINAGFPILTYKTLDALELRNRDRIKIDLKSGDITNLENGKLVTIEAFSEVQMKIYQKGDLLHA